MTTPKKVAIVGSRNYGDMEAVRRFVEALPNGTIVVSGGARGVDRTAEHAARARGLQVISIHADWDKYGKSAGYRRNPDIVAAADEVVAFWDQKSNGTKHTIELAKGAGKLAATYVTVSPKKTPRTYKGVVSPKKTPRTYKGL